MTIIKTSNENMAMKDIYMLTLSPKIGKMSTVPEGAILWVQSYVLREDVNKDGEPVQILTVMDTDGNVYGTNSSTFIKDFFDIVTMCEKAGVPVEAVQVLHSMSKNGRSFIQCVYVS